MSKGPETSDVKKLNKSEWIRNQPASLTATEVVAKGKAEGIKLTVSQVYTARRKLKGKANGSTVAGAAAPAPAEELSSDELMFRRLVLRIGMSAAEKYLLLLKQSVGL